MEERETLKCPDCGYDTGETIEELMGQKVSSVVCEGCGKKIVISPLRLDEVIRGYPKR